jgi:hypothetical protein
MTKRLAGAVLLTASLLISELTVMAQDTSDATDRRGTKAGPPKKSTKKAKSTKDTTKTGFLETRSEGEPA